MASRSLQLLAVCCLAAVIGASARLGGATSPAAAVTPLDTQGPCMAAASARNATEFAACEAHINAQPFSDDKIVALKECLAASTRGYTGEQIATLLSLFSFSSDQLTVLQLLNPFMLGMTCQEVAGVLGELSFSSDKISALQNIVNVSAIVDISAEKEGVIIDQFSFSSDKATAKALLAGMIPRSCLYGQITVKTAVFVVDTSGSMSTSFVDPAGDSTTRLEYVKKDLIQVLTKQLQQWQQFNILRFSYGVTHLFSSPQDVNAANVATAVNYVNSWTADGGTNAYDALVSAYSNPDVNAVYFLSDGTPSVGVTSPSQIIAKVQSLSKDGQVPCNTIAFVEGNDGSDKQAAMNFMHTLATATHGVSRSMSGN